MHSNSFDGEVTRLIHAGYLKKSPPLNQIRPGPKFLSSLFCGSASNFQEVTRPKIMQPFSRSKAKSRTSLGPQQSKTRFFRLYECHKGGPATHKLVYFKDEKSNHSKGQIDLSEVSALVKNPEHGHAGAHEFLIRGAHKSKPREYRLSASNQSEVDVWIDHLTRVCGLVADHSGGRSSHGSRSQRSESVSDMRSIRAAQFHTGPTLMSNRLQRPPFLVMDSAHLHTHNNNSLSRRKSLPQQSPLGPSPTGRPTPGEPPISCSFHAGARSPFLATPKACTLPTNSSAPPVIRPRPAPVVPVRGTSEYVSFPPPCPPSETDATKGPYYNVDPQGTVLSDRWDSPQRSPVTPVEGIDSFGDYNAFFGSALVEEVEEGDYCHSQRFPWDKEGTTPMGITRSYSHESARPPHRPLPPVVDGEQNYYNLNPNTAGTSPILSHETPAVSNAAPENEMRSTFPIQSTLPTPDSAQSCIHILESGDIPLPQRKSSGFGLPISSSSSSTCDLSSSEDEDDENVSQSVASKMSVARSLASMQGMSNAPVTSRPQLMFPLHYIESGHRQCIRGSVELNVGRATTTSGLLVASVSGSSNSNRSSHSDMNYVSINPDATGALASLLLDQRN